MKLKLYQIDAFTDTLFSGNPEAVVPLSEEWIDDDIMQKIAMENNLAETGFYIKKDNQYSIRWFTPEIEMDLCGHATLAAGFVLFTFEGINESEINFQSRSGILKVTQNNEYLTLDFPADVIKEVELTEELKSGFNVVPLNAFKGKSDYMLIFENESQIKNMIYDLSKISKIQCRGIIITAPGEKVDFVSRFFAPQSGINEDPVTGSAHTTLMPYWKNVLNRSELLAKQLSKRQGFLKCKYENNRIKISGKAVLYLRGEIEI